jgi:pentatricopeptide repeat protein
LHAFINGSGLDSIAEEVQSSLCVMYGKCGSFEDASKAFDRLGDDADVKVWTSLMSAYNQYNERHKTIRIFGQMLQQSALPNKVTFFALLDACARCGSISEGKRLHVRIISAGYAIDARIETALVDMYGKCGSLEESSRVFHSSLKQDIVLFTTMMASYAMNDKVRNALDLFHKACRTSLKPDEVTFINLLSMCSHAGLVEEGRTFFCSMSRDHRIEPNIYHYNCMIDMLARAGRLKEAEDMIGNIPCPATASHCLDLLSSCRRRFDVERGEQQAAHQSLLLDSDALYIELSNIYASLNRDVDLIGLQQHQITTGG